MPDTHEKDLQEIIADRLVSNVDGVDENRGGESPNGESATLTPTTDAAPEDETLPERLTESPPPPAIFAKVEKSLISLGFFTPSSRRIKNQKIKTISFVRTVDGRKVEGTVEFHPSATLGLPITADQDKFLALHHIITDLLKEKGTLSNPIRFTSAELLRLLDKGRHSGKNYKDISEWLDVMMSTTIMSNGTVYEAGKKTFARDRFHVFQRAVSVGKELPDGTIADANYIWLSDWQVDNINAKFLLPIDLVAYRRLKTHIAKALVPLLQVWLFASQNKGSFEKRYDELCEMLGLKMHRVPSLIKQQLSAPLNELTHYEYLKNWQIERTADKRSFKIILFHGPKFHRDRNRRLVEKLQAEAPILVAQAEPLEPNLPEPGKLDVSVERQEGSGNVVDPKQPRRASVSMISEVQKPECPKPEIQRLIDELSARDVMPATARTLLESLAPERLEGVVDYIDYWDSTRRRQDVGPGLLFRLIKNGEPLPSNFESRSQRQERQTHSQRQESLDRVNSEMKAMYEDHRAAFVDRFIAEELGPDEFKKRVEQRKNELRQQGGLWDAMNRPEILARVAAADVRRDIASGVVVSYEDFYRRHVPGVLEKLGLDPFDLGLPAVDEQTNF